MTNDEQGKFADFARDLPNVKFDYIFDVGANIGETVAEALQFHPGTEIHAFEPVRKSFRQMSDRFAQTTNVHCHHFALGSTPGEALVTARGTATGNHIVQTAPKGMPVETVTVRTGDEFSKSVGINRIAFLKIDTEGQDLDALMSFSEMLADQKVDLFQVEVATGLQNKKHIHFDRFQDLAYKYQYCLFKFYNQTLELKGLPIARRADAVFVSLNCAKENMRISPEKRSPLIKRLIPKFLR